MNTKSTWQWWAGEDEERFGSGPHPTREAAIHGGRVYYGDRATFCVAEALRAEYVDLAEHFDVDAMFERLAESVDDNHGDPDGDPLLDHVKTASVDTLERMIRAEIRRWQELHRITVTPWQFEEIRNLEAVPPSPAIEEAR